MKEAEEGCCLQVLCCSGGCIIVADAVKVMRKEHPMAMMENFIVSRLNVLR